MSEPRLDAPLIRRLLNEQGISQRDLGRCLGMSPAGGGRILEGRSHGDMTVRELGRLGDLLGVDVGTLFQRVTAPDALPTDDDVRLEAALIACGRESLTRPEIIETFGWQLRRVRLAIASLQSRLPATGQRLDEPSTVLVALRARDEVLTAEERKRLHRALLRRRGTNVRVARVIAAVIDSDGLDARRVGTLSYDQQAMHAHLLKQEVLVNDDGTTRLHPDAAFSLGLYG